MSTKEKISDGAPVLRSSPATEGGSVPASRLVSSLAPPIDRSCQVPLLALFGGAALWLVVGSVLAMIASIKFHAPDFLADSAWLTYGRVQPAADNALLYGFCIPAALGVMLWLFARLSQAPLCLPFVTVAAASLWHLGVLVGDEVLRAESQNRAGGVFGVHRVDDDQLASPGQLVGQVHSAGPAVHQFHVVGQGQAGHRLDGPHTDSLVAKQDVADAQDQHAPGRRHAPRRGGMLRRFGLG